MFATVEVSLGDFDLDSVIEYVEYAGYTVTKDGFDLEEGDDDDDGVSAKHRRFLIQQRSIELLDNRVTARDYLTDILELTHHASESEILERVKQVINQ